MDRQWFMVAIGSENSCCFIWPASDRVGVRVSIGYVAAEAVYYSVRMEIEILKRQCSSWSVDFFVCYYQTVIPQQLIT